MEESHDIVLFPAFTSDKNQRFIDLMMWEFIILVYRKETWNRSITIFQKQNIQCKQKIPPKWVGFIFKIQVKNYSHSIVAGGLLEIS